MGGTTSVLQLGSGNPDTSQYTVITEEGSGWTFCYCFDDLPSAKNYYESRYCCRILFSRSGAIIQDNGAHARATITAAFKGLQSLTAPRMVLDRYQIQTCLGKGGFGVVWKAIDIKDHNKEVAIKEEQLDPTATTSQKDWIREEIKAHKTITSFPAVPRVPKFIAEVSSPGSTPLFVMELIPGQTAFAHFERQGISQPNLIHFLRNCLETLSAVHKKRVIHRDLKPQNIIIHRDTGEPWILDFGTAKSLALASMSKVTDVGTLAFRAPESAHHVGAYTDIFSLGCCALALTNKITDHDTTWDTVLARCTFFPGLKDVLGKMIEFESSKRFQCCEDVLTALSTLTSH